MFASLFPVDEKYNIFHSHGRIYGRQFGGICGNNIGKTCTQEINTRAENFVLTILNNFMLNLITIGDAVLDTQVQIDEASLDCNLDAKNCKLCLDFASKIPITDSFQAIGGDGANIALGATKLGLKSALLTTVGDDSNGKIIIDELKKSGINLDLSGMDKKAQTRYSIVLNYKEERTILSLHQKRKYIWPETMPETSWIYYTGLSEGFETLQNKIFKYLKKHPSVRMAFTPGSFQLKHALPEMVDTLKQTDALIVNLQEAEKLAGTTFKKEKTINALIHKLLNLGVKEVVITDGANGAWAGNKEEIWFMSPYPVEVVSKTGAGDAFASAYVSARFYGYGFKTSLIWGTANSCGVIGQFGAGKGLLDKKGIEKIAKKYSKITPKQI